MKYKYYVLDNIIIIVLPMTQINDKTVIILSFSDDDRISSTFDQLCDFDYVRGLIISKIQDPLTKILNEPEIYLIKMEYDSQNGLTSEIFSIIHQYLKNKKFTGLTYQNIEVVIKFLIEFAIPCDYYNDIERQLLFHTLNTTTNTQFLLRLLTNNMSKITTEKTIDFCRIISLFQKENLLDDFHNICGNIYIDLVLGNNFVSLDNNNSCVISHDKYITLIINLAIYRRESKCLTGTTDIFTYLISTTRTYSNPAKSKISIALNIAQPNKINTIEVYKLQHHKKKLVGSYSNNTPNTNISPHDIFVLNDNDTHLFVTATKE